MATKQANSKNETRFTPYTKRKPGLDNNTESNKKIVTEVDKNNLNSMSIPVLTQNTCDDQQPAMPDTTGSEIILETGDPIPTTSVKSEDQQQRTLYVGNLDPHVTEELLMTLFSQITPCLGCKIIYEPGNDPYAFIDFQDNSAAAAALQAMNKIQVMGREMKVNWASSPGNAAPKTDTSKHFHIFVGDLSPDIEQHQLKDAFTPFGLISDVKIIKDPHTLKSKGYGFVSFVKKEEAENAIQGMNGQWIGSRAIRTNWASRKPSAPQDTRSELSHQKHLSHDEVFAQSSPTNCTVYVGGILTGLTDDLMHKTFGELGTIQEVRVFKDKGYAFVRYDNKKAATNAIIKYHGSEIGGHVVKCSWGKESPDAAGNPMAPYVAPVGTTNANYYGAPPQMSYGYGQQGGYGVPAYQPNYYGGQQQNYGMPVGQWPAYQGQNLTPNQGNFNMQQGGNSGYGY